MRTSTLLAAIAALVALGGGALFFFALGGTGDTAPPATAPAAAKPADAAPVKPAATAAPELARLQEENALLKEQLDNVRAELAAAQRAREAATAEAAAQADTVNAQPLWEELREAAEDGADRGERRRGPGGWSEERAAEFRAGIDTFYEEAIAASTEPETQERLAALQDYTNRMMDLRQQMRAAEDPAARQALEDELDALRDEMRPLVREQQDHLLREAAAASGVTDRKVQTQLIDAMRDTMRSPFFMDERGFRRGGGGGRWGS